MPAVKVPSSIRRFDTGELAAAALATSMPPARPTKPAPAISPTSASLAIAFDAGDDDFDMEIERNVGGHDVAADGVELARSMSGAQLFARPSVAGTGLELGAPSRMRRERAAAEYDEEDEPSTASSSSVISSRRVIRQERRSRSGNTCIIQARSP